MNFKINTVDEILEAVKEKVEEMGDNFTEPDDDWLPVFILFSKKGTYVLPAPFQSEQEKDIYVQLIKAAIKGKKAYALVFVCSTWSVVQEKANLHPESIPDHVPMPSEHPDRVEGVMINVFSAEKSISTMAHIIRHEDSPPTLEEWDDLDGGLSMGRMVTPFQDALKTVYREEKENNEES